MCYYHKLYYAIACGIYNNLIDMLPGIVPPHICLPSMILIIIIIKYTAAAVVPSFKYIAVNIYRPEECRCCLHPTSSIKREEDRGGHRHGSVDRRDRIIIIIFIIFISTPSCAASLRSTRGALPS